MTPPIGLAGAWAKFVNAIKDWPLWLLIAVAAILTVLYVVPDFRDLVPVAARVGVLFALVAAWIIVSCKAGAAIIQSRLRPNHERPFVITPVEAQSLWGISKQTDDTFVTQVTGRFMVKNRTNEPLHLMTAAVVRPRISGEVLPGLLTMLNPNEGTHGTAYVSGNFIPPHETLPVSATILIRGVPRQKAGPMIATIEMNDADGHRERVKMTLRCVNFPGK